VFETATVALATFFATVGPIDVAAVFAILTREASGKIRRSMAIRSSLIAGGILFLFALTGESLLAGFGISLAALRTSGGILLLLIGIEMVFARPSGATTTTREETEEASTRMDISVFPLATPLIAGPGTIGAAILLMANTEKVIIHQLIVLSSLFVILLITFCLMLGASKIQKLFGITGMNVISRIFGILLSALAVQFIFDGIKQSGIF
jgi:multiple antibiotic resistance protein